MSIATGSRRPQRRDAAIVVPLALATLLPAALQRLLPPSAAWICVGLQGVALLAVLLVLQRRGGLRWQFILAMIVVPAACWLLC